MVRFELKRPDQKKPTAVILHYRCSNGELKYYTGRSVEPDKYKPSLYGNIVAFVQKLQSSCDLAERKLTKEILKEKLDVFLQKRKPGISDFDAVIESMKSGDILTKEKKRYSDETIKSMKTAVRVLREFRPNVLPQDIELNFYEKLIVHCNEQGYRLNTTGTIIRRLKTLMRISGIAGHEEFKTLREDTPDIALTEGEIKQLAAKKLEQTHALVRDWAIIGCYMGLRISDLKRLGKVNITKDSVVISNEKTDASVTLPIHPLVKKILKDNNGFPERISEQRFNTHIKEVAQALKWNEMFLYTSTKGGERNDEYIPRWKMISSHTCRRTFITNLLAAKIPESIIMMLAGIKSHTTLAKYNKLTPAQAAAVVADLWQKRPSVGKSKVKS